MEDVIAAGGHLTREDEKLGQGNVRVILESPRIRRLLGTMKSI